jgi:hypothetical protein
MALLATVRSWSFILFLELATGPENPLTASSRLNVNSLPSHYLPMKKEKIPWEGEFTH